MRHTATLIAFAILTAAPVLAQSPAPVTGEVEFDVRVHPDTGSYPMSWGGWNSPPGYGPEQSGGHGIDTSLSRIISRLDADLGRGTTATVTDQHDYGADAVQEAVLSRDTGCGIISGGLVRLPFGIFDTRETYDSGLIAYPLVRSDYEYEGVDWGAPGAEWTGGSPWLQVQAAAFDGGAVGDWNNRNAANGGVVRLQTYSGSLIVGASRWDGTLSPTDTFAARQVVQISGIDWRYTRPQLILRGELITGKVAGDDSFGWYEDVYYRLPPLPHCTLVARVEEFHPESDSPTGRQITLGIRYVLDRYSFAAFNWRRNNGRGMYLWSWAQPTTPSGDYLLQLTRMVDF
ncbi:MAG: hypothetical protein ACLQVD_07695 [Capsulimonadaceae bacterium]